MENNSGKEIIKILILKGADPLLVFDDAQKVVDFFGNDIEWMPEDLKQKIRRMSKGKVAFGM